jgi:hypothetical protein
VTKKEIAMLMMVTIISNCLGNLGSDIVHSAFKSLVKNYQQFQQNSRSRYIARLRKNSLHAGPQT